MARKEKEERGKKQMKKKKKKIECEQFDFVYQVSS